MQGKFKNRNNEYSKQANEFCRKTGTTISIVYEDTVSSREAWGYDKNDPRPNFMHDKYKVTLRKDGKMFSIHFYGSNYDFLRNLRPDTYDILTCLSGDYFEGTIDDFVNEFGYEVNSWEDVKRIEKTYKAVCKETKSLKRLYNEDEIEMLLEIR